MSYTEINPLLVQVCKGSENSTSSKVYITVKYCDEYGYTICNSVPKNATNDEVVGHIVRAGMRSKCKLYRFEGKSFRMLPKKNKFFVDGNMEVYCMTKHEAKQYATIKLAEELRQSMMLAAENRYLALKQAPHKPYEKTFGKSQYIPKMDAYNVQAILDGDML